ncbi:hypothetical protein [Sinomicrobium weinanense]|uniref:Uncharacterized protein n=1 Tax=Sinomicrobium weinanense TaxID=2842200 RepID=A0A926JVS3_9FLAO|nr:hypothetical protein [Sinomicrobium weinanense]MBC9798093.1 hypothetical protein [Sinomicrobium weinanense]MBU3122545.1 hypothetical protein [Sinomicrobium weinanense]
MNLENLNLKKLSIQESKEITGGTEPFTDIDAANDHEFLSGAFRVRNPLFY